MPKILIFEDDRLLGGMVRSKFETEGFAVALYVSPTKDPVKIVRQEKPDIICMSVLMPVMNGFEATKKIKQDNRTKNVPLFFWTTLGQENDRLKGRQLGAVEYFQKSELTPSDLVNYVKEILGLPHQIVETIPERVKKGRRWLDILLGRQ